MDRFNVDARMQVMSLEDDHTNKSLPVLHPLSSSLLKFRLSFTLARSRLSRTIDSRCTAPKPLPESIVCAKSQPDTIAWNGKI